MDHIKRLFACVCLVASWAASGIHAQAGVEGSAQTTLSTQDVGAASAAAVGRRVIALEGQSNFRDLGGYETTDGRHVKWGMIFRSGELSHLTASDYERISALHVRTIYDLRDRSERASQPTVWGAGPVQTFASAKSGTVSSAMGPLADPNIDAARARAALANFYGEMPRLYAPEYRAIFHELLADDVPLLLHCTAGKDRSGLASALILTALGVPRTTVLQDYELTDQLLKPSTAPPQTEFMRRFQSLPAAVRHAMMSADPQYIESAFSAIETGYGSIDNYFLKELAVGPAQIKQLRDQYLEPDSRITSPQDKQPQRVH